MLIYNIGIPKHKKRLRLLSSGTKLFITFEFKGFSTLGERYHLSILTFPSAPSNTCGARSAQIRLASPKSQSQLTDFSQISQNLRCTLPVHDVIHILWSHFLSGIFIFASVNDTSSPRARQHLRASLHLTNPYAKRKVLSLTKPKDRIYKTKYLGHYITCVQTN